MIIRKPPFAIDGSKIELPNSKSNFEFFGEMFGYPDPSRRFAIEEFSGATTTSVLQEFYINVLLSNLSSLIKNQVDEEIQITAKSTNKYRYQANRAFIIGRVKTIVPKILCNLFDLYALDILYKESLRCRSQIMPGRTFRRKKNKAISRTLFNNKKVAF